MKTHTEKIKEEIAINKYKSYFKDFDNLDKESLRDNLLEAVKNLDRLEDENKLFQATEKERLRLLNKTLELKKEISKLRVIKSLFEKVGIYGYEDFSKLWNNQATLKEAERHDRIIAKIKEKVLLIRKEEKVFPLTNTKESKERARLFNKLVDRITFRFAVEINKIDQEEEK
jgi:hypothetical protein